MTIQNAIEQLEMQNAIIRMQDNILVEMRAAVAKQDEVSSILSEMMSCEDITRRFVGGDLDLKMKAARNELTGVLSECIELCKRTVIFINSYNEKYPAFAVDVEYAEKMVTTTIQNKQRWDAMNARYDALATLH